MAGETERAPAHERIAVHCLCQLGACEPVGLAIDLLSQGFERVFATGVVHVDLGDIGRFHGYVTDRRFTPRGDDLERDSFDNA